MLYIAILTLKAVRELVFLNSWGRLFHTFLKISDFWLDWANKVSSRSLLSYNIERRRLLKNIREQF